jgi:hypothetical protein
MPALICRCSLLICLNGLVFGWADNLVMKKPREVPDPAEPPSKPTRLEEARRVVEEYANDLRETSRSSASVFTRRLQPSVWSRNDLARSTSTPSLRCPSGRLLGPEVNLPRLAALASPQARAV